MHGKRLLKILRAVELMSRPGGATIKDLAEDLELDRRSVYRLRDTMEALFFPIYEDKDVDGRKMRWKIQSEYLAKLPNVSLPELTLNFPEIMALCLLKGESSIYQGTEVQRHADRAFYKLGQLLPDKVSSQLEKLEELFRPVAKFCKDYSGKEEIIELLAQAMIKQRECAVEYFAFQDEQTKIYRIHPLCFFEHEGGLYLFVRVARYEDIRVLAVERIEDLQLREAGFDYPEDFQPDQILRNTFNLTLDDPIEARVWISGDQAKYVTERRFFEAQGIEEREDGSIIVHLKTSGRYDVKRWVLGFGADAALLEPEDLRQEIRDELQRALARHD
ncbi:MAG: WYL domain-containing protein [Desulfohalobiaceae bacterium]|nr:WYL domain-containing protein [Desulfohalobiaceae bacterium]